MPPSSKSSGSSSKSSGSSSKPSRSSSGSTGSRGPTGPSGQARSSPAGNRGGVPGSVSRSSVTGYRGPTGPQGQARTSPAGLRGGAAGSVSRAKPTGLRGPLSPSGASRQIGRNAPVGRRGPLGPQGQVRSSPVSKIQGAGKKFGPVSSEFSDYSRWQGPPTPEASFEKAINDYNREINEIERKRDSIDISRIAGKLSQTGAHYAPTRTQIARDLEAFRQSTVDKDRLRNSNLDRQLMPNLETRAFRQELSRLVPNVRLPSNSGFRAGGVVKKAKSKKK